MKTLVWDHLPCDDGAGRRRSRPRSSLHPTVARLLCLRGLGDPGAAPAVPQPVARSPARSVPAGRHARGGRAARAAIARRERIAIHGDYDVDGITSTVILRRALEMLGGDVVHFIPERLRDGYGLQPAAIERLHADGVRLIVSVDCGIRGTEAARRARELGVDLIITDHHEPDGELPPALAVINPKRHDCTIPTRTSPASASRSSWCRRSATRAGKASGCRRSSRSPPSARSPTSCRSSARTASSRGSGSTSLARGRTPSACGRCSTAAGLTGKTIDSYQVAFMLAPRVNAAGRMSTPDIATRLLLATDEALERRGARARPAAERREPAAPAGRGGARRCRRRRRSRPIRPSARTTCWSSAATDGTAASSASPRRSWSTRTTSRRSCCRSTATSRTARAAAFRRSTCSARSSAAPTCSCGSAATGRRRA